MIAQLLFAAKSQFFDNNGDVMTLGTVDITYSLTATPAPTYKNSAKTVANDYPIQLTAAGKADIYLDAGSYNIITKNRDGVVVDTTDEFIVSDHSQINIGGNTPIGGIIMYAGLISEIPVGWHLCDGSEGTPPLQDRFIKGTVYQDNIGDSGGSADAVIVAHTHSNAHTHQIEHTHTVPAHSHTTPVHVHSISHNHSMAHTHSISHDHGGVSATTNTIADHVHDGVMRITYCCTACSGTDAGYTVDEDFWDKDTKLAGGHAHSVTVNLPNFTGTSGSTSEGSTGGSSSPNTGSGGDAATGEQPVTTTSAESSSITTDQNPVLTGSVGETGVGANDPVFYTLAYIMRMA
jgi:hypothetical protein